MIISIGSLPSALAAIGVDDNDISIGESADSRWCIVLRSTARWSVFYRERRGDFDESVFDDEADACYAFLGRVTLRQITRGRSPLADESKGQVA